MFQDIWPHEYKCEYERKEIKKDDLLLVSKNSEVLLKEVEGQYLLPDYEDICRAYGKVSDDFVYLFSIDDYSFFMPIFMSDQGLPEKAEFKYCSPLLFRTMKPSWLAFGGATASHLVNWYSARRFCGTCAAELEQVQRERAMHCRHCGNLEYPAIAPAVIVGIVNKDKILLSKYSSGHYKKYTLIAGYVEVGESLEDAIKREIMEEVGLKVKNIRYYKSQPWAFSASILMGYFADLDGDKEILLNRDELSEATWFKRENIPYDDTTLSLTWEMIEAFRSGKF